MSIERQKTNHKRVRLTPCPICGAGTWQDFLRSSTGRLMTSDHRVTGGELKKVRCAVCGVVANAFRFRKEEIDRLYGDQYELNAAEGEEHLFFTAAGSLPRSEVFFERIRPHLPSSCRSLLEIGCGAGNLLRRLAEALPDARVFGIDGSRRAVAVARSRSLDVNRRLLDANSRLPLSDVVVCVGVLEHVEDPAAFVRTLREAVEPDGRLIFSLPIQDALSYDVLFHDHVWHFHTEHVIHLLRANGLRVVATECNHPIDTLMGLFVCEREDAAPRPVWDKDRDYARFVTRNRDAWLRVFSDVDRWLDQIGTSKLVVFGAGEVFALLKANSHLGEVPIAAILDEDPQKVGGHLAGVPIHEPKWLATQDDIAVLPAINPRYHEPIRLRLTPHTKTVFTWNVTLGSDHHVAAPSACALA